MLAYFLLSAILSEKKRIKRKAKEFIKKQIHLRITIEAEGGQLRPPHAIIADPGR